ncbi:MAG: type III secretion system protein CdsG [Simkaniaceae bacterium]
MATLDEYKEHFALFLEAGYMAVNQADEDSAIKLFKAAEILNPDSHLPKIGYGYLHLHKLELKKAIECFNEVLKVDPANDLAKSLLGISLSFMPEKSMEGEKVLETGIQETSDPELKKLNTMAIDFVENFVKKKPSPAELQAEQKKTKGKTA